jgi:hypothetical protein
VSAIESNSSAGVTDTVTPALRPSGVVDMTAPLSPTEEAAIHALHPTIGGNAGLLTSGVPCRAVLLAVLPLDAQTPAGEDATGLVLSVTIVGQPPHQLQVGVHVPPDARQLLVAGRDLPARATADGVESVTIDWPAALAEAAAGGPDSAPQGGFPIASGTEQAAPTDLATSSQETADLQSSGALTVNEFSAAEKVPLKPGDKRGAIAPATSPRDVPGERPSDDNLTELSCVIAEMNEVHVRAITALDDNPDACAELSAQWQPLWARAFELMPSGDGRP